MSTLSGIQGQLLHVTVVGCSRLKDTEWFSRQDPYVCLEYTNTMFSTHTHTDGGKNPTFQDKFVFSLVEGLHEIKAIVWNSNTLIPDNLIGSGRVQLHKVLSQGYDDSSWTIQSKNGRFAGELKLIMHFQKIKQKSAAPTAPPCMPASPAMPCPHYPPTAHYPAQPNYHHACMFSMIPTPNPMTSMYPPPPSQHPTYAPQPYPSAHYPPRPAYPPPPPSQHPTYAPQPYPSAHYPPRPTYPPPPQSQPAYAPEPYPAAHYPPQPTYPPPPQSQPAYAPEPYPAAHYPPQPTYPPPPQSQPAYAPESYLPSVNYPPQGPQPYPPPPQAQRYYPTRPYPGTYPPRY